MTFKSPESVQIKGFSNSTKKIFFNKRFILKPNNYQVFDWTVSGDAPKDFIRVYEYGNARKSNKKSWIKYIAKVGHKWYPIESVTEQLMTRIGQVLGFNIADSRLYLIKNQLRFCSKYFLKNEQELVHGAEILSKYLSEQDSKIIDQIDKQKLNQDLLTFDFVLEAILDSFPLEFDSIKSGLIQLLIFDAIVGNNDRHFYNWGVVRHVRKKHKPIFSPIYDTARGLFWNKSDEHILSLNTELKINSEIEKYAKGAIPKIGWQEKSKVNSIELLKLIIDHNHCKSYDVSKVVSLDNLNKINNIVQTEFKNILIDERITLILRYLKYRFDLISNLANR